MRNLKILSCLVACILHCCALQANDKPFIIGELDCETGNNFFQIATATALAWDNGAEAYFPGLLEKSREKKFQHLFFRCNPDTPAAPVEFHWKCPIEKNFVHTEIPYQPNMRLEKGTFQSEKYFKHHREQILELFAPHPDDYTYVRGKYGEYLDHPMTVGVQMRWWGRSIDAPWHTYLVQYGKDYFTKATQMFPKEALFIVSSNDARFIKENFPKVKNVLILNGEPDYIEFLILSLCKHQIISNSTFGWWAAWLNQNPNKIVIAPWEWQDPAWHHLTPVKDVYPEDWIKIQAKWKKPYNRK